jgi:uncharacterized protein
VRLDAQNLDTLARGSALLGSGGGGAPDLGLLMALAAVDQAGAVPVVSLDELDDDAFVMPCGLVGSPPIARERLWSGDEGHTLCSAVQRLGIAQVTAIMCYAVAGMNGLLPVMWAARLGLPLVDADGMGRAFPELQQQTMHLADVPASPVVLADGRGNVQMLYAVDDRSAERMARRIVAAFGGVCAGALYCMTALQARDATIAGSLTRALQIGEAMSAPTPRDRIDALQRLHDAVVLVEGEVVHVERHFGDGFARGAATIRERANGGRELRVEFQNEFLLVIEDGGLCASVPDLVCILGSETGDPVATERVRQGERVAVLALPAPAVWRSPAGLAVGGPRAFGYDLDYAPLRAEVTRA